MNDAPDIDALARSDLDLATAWEAVARTIPDRVALAHGDVRRSWRELEDRAARLAAAFDANGIGHGAKVAVALHNGNEYVETEFAAFKVRAIPCNVNYRYGVDELRYVLDNADAEVLVFDETLRDRVEVLRGDALPKLRLLVDVGDGPPAWAHQYEELLASHEPAAPIRRSGEDLWFLYTGGTTGNPKAVMWDQRGLLGSMIPTFKSLGHVVPSTVEELVPIVRDVTDRNAEVRQLAASPLMHGTAGLSTKATLMHGGMVATLQSHSFDADELWRCIERERITLLTIVGDVFSRSMIDSLERAEREGRPYDLSSLRSIVSSGVMWSEQVKQALLDHHDVTLVDILGSSEGTGMARQVSSRKRQASAATARFELGEHSRVFTDDGRDVAPGSGEIGRIALGFPIPRGYYKDPEKTDTTFPMIAGRRWSIPGDHATVEADGTITLLGRGSACINTGGEKVYPEEVEEAVKTHPAVADCNVVGLPDERWGQRVTAVVALTPVHGAPRAVGAPGARAPTADEIRSHVRAQLAGYKVPKSVVFVAAIQRGANGKPDYRWARAAAEAAGA